MKVCVFAPYAAYHQEVGLISAVANYLASKFPEVAWLQCNGVFSLCERDAEASWNRNLSSCFRCMSQQQALFNWANLQPLRLSSFLSPEDIWESKRWIVNLSSEALLDAELKGVRLLDLCRETFYNRFGISDPDPKNKNHEQFLRRLALATLRACLSAAKFNNRFMPELSLVASGSDFLTASFQKQSLIQRRNVALFKWEVTQKAVIIKSPYRSETFKCEFLLEDVTSMRSDCSTWPAELLQVVKDILFYLDVPEDQMRLPLAR